jgi:Lectin C-type domain
MGCQVVCSLLGEGAVESQDHHCYRTYEEASFEDAQAACEALGGYLATIADKKENELVRPLVTSSNFIGGFEDVALMSGGHWRVRVGQR